MGQNKLENQIKEKLNSREIQPSAQAWDRLDAMLSVDEQKKTKRSFGWLYIAAGITVLLIAGMFFFSQNATDISNQDTITGSEVKNDSVKTEQNKFQAPIHAIEDAQNQVAESTETQNPKSNNQISNKEAVSIISQKSNQKQSGNPRINQERRIEYQNNSDVALKDSPKADPQQKIAINKSDIPSGVKGNLSSSDEELLASLDKVGKKSADKSSSLKVDAKSLLSQVDGEVEYSFRERVINKVSKNYKEVKVALSNRNNE